MVVEVLAVGVLAGLLLEPVGPGVADSSVPPGVVVEVLAVGVLAGLLLEPVGPKNEESDYHIAQSDNSAVL